MGFNLGAFAGGLASGGIKTYQTLTDIERQKAIDAREEERLGFERQRAAEAERQVGLTKGAEEQMRNSTLPTTGGIPLEDVVNAASPTVSNVERAGGAGAVRTDIPMSAEALETLQARIAGMSPQEQAKAIQAYGSVTLPNAPNAERAGGAASAIPLANAVTYKDENGKTFVSQPVTDEATIVANMKQRAYASGNPVAIKQANDMEAQVLQKTQVRQAIQLGSKQILTADRAERDAQKVEEFQTWHSGMVEKAQQDPMEAAKAMVVEYNTGAQHKDGQTAKIVTGPNTAPLMVFINDKTGQQIGNAMPITAETVQQGIEQMAFQKWKTLPGNFKAGLEQMNKERELANQSITAQAAQTSAGAAVTNAGANVTNADTAARRLAEEKAVDLFGANARHLKAVGDAALTNASANVTSAGAHVTTANTGADTLKQQIAAGLFPAQAQNLTNVGNAALTNASANVTSAGAHVTSANAAAKTASSTADYHAILKQQIENKATLDAETRAEVAKVTDAWEKLSPADREGPKGQDLIAQGVLAIARKSNDLTGVLNFMKKPDKNANKTIITDPEKFVQLFGTQPSSFKDSKNGDQPIPINKLSPAQLIKEMELQKEDNSAGGLPAPNTEAMQKPGAATSALPVSTKPVTSKSAIDRGIPLRSTDGGKTYTVDVPETIKDPSVKYYKEITNPAYKELNGKTFKSAFEAEAAYLAATGGSAIPINSTIVSKDRQKLLDFDKGEILKRELKNAEAVVANKSLPEAQRIRAQEDVAALNREIARLTTVRK